MSAVPPPVSALDFTCPPVTLLLSAGSAGASARACLLSFLSSSLGFTAAAGPSGDAALTAVGGGITNGLLHVPAASGVPGDALLVRVYGEATELLIDRECDTATTAFLSAARAAPRLYAVFHNGRVEAFLPGVRALEPHEMRARTLAVGGGGGGSGASFDVCAALASAVARRPIENQP